MAELRLRRSSRPRFPTDELSGHFGAAHTHHHHHCFTVEFPFEGTDLSGRFGGESHRVQIRKRRTFAGLNPRFGGILWFSVHVRGGRIPGTNA